MDANEAVTLEVVGTGAREMSDLLIGTGMVMRDSGVVEPRAYLFNLKDESYPVAVRVVGIEFGGARPGDQAAYSVACRALTPEEIDNLPAYFLANAGREALKESSYRWRCKMEEEEEEEGGEEEEEEGGEERPNAESNQAIPYDNWRTFAISTTTE